MAGLIFGAIGIKTIVTRNITLYINLWDNSSSDFTNDNRGI
jgi:hypothetical protein